MDRLGESEHVAVLDLRPGRTASWTYRRAMAAVKNGVYVAADSAGLYLGGLINETGERLHMPGLHVNGPYFAAAFAAVVTVYFWRKNIIGIHESSEKALRIMQITTVMVVI